MKGCCDLRRCWLRTASLSTDGAGDRLLAGTRAGVLDRARSSNLKRLQLFPSAFISDSILPPNSSACVRDPQEREKKEFTMWRTFSTAPHRPHQDAGAHGLSNPNPAAWLALGLPHAARSNPGLALPILLLTNPTFDPWCRRSQWEAQFPGTGRRPASAFTHGESAWRRPRTQDDHIFPGKEGTLPRTTVRGGRRRIQAARAVPVRTFPARCRASRSGTAATSLAHRSFGSNHQGQVPLRDAASIVPHAAPPRSSARGTETAYVCRGVNSGLGHRASSTRCRA